MPSLAFSPSQFPFLNAQDRLNIAVLTQSDEFTFPSFIHQSSNIVFHKNLFTLPHLMRFKRVDALFLELKSFKKEAHTFLMQRTYNLLLSKTPLFIAADSNKEIEVFIPFAIDDFYVGELESSLFTFRLQKFLKHAEALSIEARNQKNPPIELAFMAYYDTLTGLANRQLFEERVQEKIKDIRAEQTPFSLLFLDLNGFKNVNDAHGHTIGDWLLCQVASRLRSCVKKTDTVARIGGDEFSLILDNIEDRMSIQNIVHRVLYHLNSPYSYQGEYLRISVSIGVSLFPKNGNTYHTLIHKADRAMYQAKKQDKEPFCFA